MSLDFRLRRKPSTVQAVVARARGQSAAIAVHPQPQPFSWVVDLASEPIGPTWWRGVATLAGLCAAAVALGPAFPRLQIGDTVSAPAAGQFQMNPMLSATAEQAETPPPRAVSPDEMAKPIITRTANAIRVQGQVTEGLYWSLRDAGISAEVTADYLRALSTQIDVGDDVAPFDRFDLVMARGADGVAGPLLFAAVHRMTGGDVELVKWTSQGRTDWFNGAAAETRTQGLMAPVAGRITSGFGMRYHPILHYARMHAGIDFGAPFGSPIVAAADGQVVVAGWGSGYGREVQVAHADGIVSLYGHMSGIVAQPGQMVRQGQVIGYVGSSGLSTGPHLHFEVKVGGRAVNPLSVQLQSRSNVDPAQMAAFRARVRYFESIGAKGAA